MLKSRLRGHGNGAHTRGTDAGHRHAASMRKLGDVFVL